MSDLVEMLRNRPNDAPMPSEMLMDAAADQIERLERLLMLAKLALEYHTQQTRPIHATQQTIRAIDLELQKDHQA